MYIFLPSMSCVMLGIAFAMYAVPRPYYVYLNGLGIVVTAALLTGERCRRLVFIERGYKKKFNHK